VEFGGWDMPVYYTNVIDEHITTRTKAGLFDISHMGEFFIEGKDSFDFIQKIITNDLNKLIDGKALYSCICLENGGVIDDLFVYRFNQNKFMLVVNAANIDKDFNWLLKNKAQFNITITDKTSDIAKIDIQGPNSEEILQKLTQADLKSLKRFHFIENNVNNIPTIISRTGYTGEDGFELYINAKKAEELWNTLLKIGEPFGLKPIGLGARDTLRIEACYSLYGHELNEEINPIEAGIGFAVKFDKEDFIGKEALIKIKDNIKRTIISFKMRERGIPRENYDILKDNNKIGNVTSGTLSPTLKKGIGMGFVSIENSETDTEIQIKIREKLYKATIVPKPIYSFKGGK